MHQLVPPGAQGFENKEFGVCSIESKNSLKGFSLPSASNPSSTLSFFLLEESSFDLVRCWFVKLDLTVVCGMDQGEIGGRKINSHATATLLRFRKQLVQSRTAHSPFLKHSPYLGFDEYIFCLNCFHQFNLLKSYLFLKCQFQCQFLKKLQNLSEPSQHFEP